MHSVPRIKQSPRLVPLPFTRPPLTRSLENDGGRMVEEGINSANKPGKTKTARPKPVYLWSVLDVQKWLRRHCSDYYNLYSEIFLHHEVTGRALIRINDNSLLRMGIENSVHREEIWREIIKLRLKTDIMEIRDLERQNTTI